MITSSGLVCDVCGKYILFGTMDNFSISGHNFQAHSGCIPVVKEMVNKKDYKVLPEGPLKKLYIEQEAPNANKTGE